MFRLFSLKLKNTMPKLHLSAEALLDPASNVCMSQMEPVMVEAPAWLGSQCGGVSHALEVVFLPGPGWILAEDVRLVMSNLVSLDRVSTSVTHHGVTTKHGAPAAFSCPSLPPAPTGGHGIAGRGPGDHQHWCHLHPHLPAGQLL